VVPERELASVAVAAEIAPDPLELRTRDDPSAGVDRDHVPTAEMFTLYMPLEARCARTTAVASAAAARERMDVNGDG
jgi:hypothetical protein